MNQARFVPLAEAASAIPSGSRVALGGGWPGRRGMRPLRRGSPGLDGRVRDGPQLPPGRGGREGRHARALLTRHPRRAPGWGLRVAVSPRARVRRNRLRDGPRGLPEGCGPLFRGRDLRGAADPARLGGHPRHPGGRPGQRRLLRPRVGPAGRPCGEAAHRDGGGDRAGEEPRRAPRRDLPVVPPHPHGGDRPARGPPVRLRARLRDRPRPHVEEYLAASRSPEAFAGYLSRYVLGKTEEEYLGLAACGRV